MANIAQIEFPLTPQELELLKNACRIRDQLLPNTPLSIEGVATFAKRLLLREAANILLRCNLEILQSGRTDIFPIPKELL